MPKKKEAQIKPPKIVWRVAERPSGPYASFQKRGWPTAYYDNSNDGKVCATIICKDDYYPSDVKTGNHAPLTLQIANYEQTPWIYVRSTQKYATLAEAKEALPRILVKYPTLIPEVLTYEFGRTNN